MTPLVGRDAELAELADALGLDGSGPQEAVLLGGDAGIGKTRLVTEIVERAEAGGVRVLVGHCLDLGDHGVPYQPIVEALTALPGSAHSGQHGDDERARGRDDVLSSVATALDVLAAEGPVLLVVEDAHWADASTRHLVRFLLVRRFAGPVSLLVTYRSDDLHRTHPLRAALTEWMRLPGVRRTELTPLPDAEVAALLRSRAAVSADGVAAIVRRAAGNAFYAEELLDAGIADGSLPEDLADLLLVRVDRLGEAARRVVAAAACAGGPIGDVVLAEVAEVQGADLDAALREAVDLKVLVAQGESYAFRHALIAEAVHDDLLPGERRRLHAAFLAALGEAAPAAEVALHAHAAGQPTIAYLADVRAAADAVWVGGYDEAAVHLERAVHACDVSPVGSDIVALVIDWADALLAAGDGRRALSVLTDHAARPIGGLVRDELDRGRLQTALANTALLLGRDQMADEAAASALALVPDEPTLHRATAEAVAARAAAEVGRFDEAVERGERAMSLAELHDDSELAVAVQTTLTRIIARSGVDPDKTIRRYEELVETSKATGNLRGELRALHHLAFLHTNAGELVPATALFREVMERAATGGLQWAPHGFDGRFFLAELAYMQGRWDEVLDLTSAAGAPPLMATSLAAVATQVRVARGEALTPAEIASLRELWTHDVAPSVHASCALVDQRAWEGDVRGAWTVHEELEDTFAATWGFRDGPWRLRMMALAAAALSTRGRVAPSAEHADLLARADGLVEIADRIGGMYPSMGPEGHAWRARLDAEVARLPWVLGRPADGLAERWRDVVDRFTALGDPYETARSRVRLAGIEAAAGCDVSTLLAAAHGAATALGARRLLDEIDALRPARTPKPTKSGLAAALTQREREVLALVAEGRSNGEVAAQLFISTKTASVHVSNILGKLGAATRTEAAAIARRDGLLDG